MKFLIVTHVPHGNAEQLFAYAPYVREMNLWIKYADQVAIVAPVKAMPRTPIHASYLHNNIKMMPIAEINFQGFMDAFRSVINMPGILWSIFKAMKAADHIHLRCPGNIGLLGCIVQILFPKKVKTAKYAGNWDPKAIQPKSYVIQKWILANTFLTRNMKVLVYGNWVNSTENIQSFFTASYREADKLPVAPKTIQGKINFLFVGTLAIGKQPLYVIKLIEKLHKAGYAVGLNLYGEGLERFNLESYITAHDLKEVITLKGDQKEDVVRKAYLDSHFLLLPSKSEGWPKVVAEAMFWGCVPIASAVSCVPDMLDHGNRGLLLQMNIESDFEQIQSVLKNEDDYQAMTKAGIVWSRHYTLDLFENNIASLITS